MHAGFANWGFPLRSAVGENVPGIPGACATRNFTYLVRGTLPSLLTHICVTRFRWVSGVVKNTNWLGNRKICHGQMRLPSNLAPNTCQISKFSCFSSRLTDVCSVQWSQTLSREWRCSLSSADRRCSNYIWVVDDFIAYYGSSYIKGLTVVQSNRGSNEISCVILSHRGEDSLITLTESKHGFW